jgi:glycosyltransferase involved in cell wall biosynthesis
MKKKIEKNLVSVVIPAYNQVDFIGATLDSVLDQDYPLLEIIVTDDGSTDGTSEVISKYADKFPNIVIPVLNKFNSGIPKNFNRGLAKANGEFIAWFGGDDLMLPAKISKQVKALQLRSDAVGCVHDAFIFETASSEILGLFSVLMNGRPGLKEGGVELWFDSSYFMLPSAVMVRSSAIPSHGFDERLKYANDWLLDVEIFMQGMCVVIDEPLCKYRRHANNITSNEKARLDGIEEGMVALSIIESRYPILHKYVRKKRINLLLTFAVAAYRKNNIKDSLAYLRTAFFNGAPFRAAGLALALKFYGKRIVQSTSLMLYQRSFLFKKLSKLIKGSLW